MRQLELLLGANNFREGLREYLAAHKFGNATWADLIRVLDARTDADLAAWSLAWVEDRGRPRITVAIDRASDGTRITLTQDDPLARSLVWPQRLSVAVAYADRIDLVDADLDRAKVIDIPPGRHVLWVLPTAKGLGYGDFVLDNGNLTAIAAALPKMTDPLTRGSALVTLWESMLEGRLEPARMRDVIAAALPAESDELNTSQLLEYSRTLFWRFTAADDRGDVAPKLEGLLKAGLDRAKTTSQKSAWFGTLRSVATTPETVGWLERLWRHDVKIPGLPFSETDEADLALDLAVRDVPAAKDILDEQFTRFTNDDRKARFAFVRAAVSSDAASRESFFESLKDVNNRRREAWVLDAERYLPSPAASGLIEEVRARRARPGARDSADGRHLFPEKMGRRDTVRLPVAANSGRGAADHRSAAAGLPAPPEVGPPVVGRPAIPRRRRYFINEHPYRHTRRLTAQGSRRTWTSRYPISRKP
jgi:aminopeptidase N